MADLFKLLNEIGDRWLANLVWLLAYAGIFVIVERFGRAVPGQRILRKGFATDLLHSFMNPTLAAPIAAAVFALVQIAAAGLNQRSAAMLGVWPWGLQLLAALFVADFIGYWRHRLLHTYHAWPFHAVHHSSEEMDWLSNDRVDVGENLITEVLSAAGLFCLGFTSEIVFWNMVVRRSYGLFIHSNLAWSYGPLDYLFVSPRFHRWHHAADARAIDRNFATFFSCLDWLFRTYFMPKLEFPEKLGLVRETMPESYSRQVSYPFVTLLARVRRSVLALRRSDFSPLAPRGRGVGGEGAVCDKTHSSPPAPLPPGTRGEVATTALSAAPLSEVCP